MLLPSRQHLKPGVTQCDHCAGWGRISCARSGDWKTCDACLAVGRYTRMDASNDDHYEARDAAGSLVEAGGPLDEFLASLPVLVADDLVVWLVSDDAPKVVCVVRPGWETENVVVWL